MNQIQVGQSVPLVLQVHDGKIGLKVSAEIISVYGLTLSKAYLDSIGGGLYISNEFKMPNATILVQYKVEDSEEYAVTSEMFSPLPEAKQEPKFITGSVTRKSKAAKYIDGVIYETKNIK